MKLYLLPLLALVACSTPNTSEKETSDSTGSVENGSATEATASESVSTGLRVSKVNVTHHYTGIIGGKYKFLMNLQFKADTLEGQYRYYTQKDFLQVRGTMDSKTNNFTLEESYYDFKKGEAIVSGHFEGIKKGDTVSGKWFNNDRSKSFDFVLSTYEKPIPGLEIWDNSIVDENFKSTDTVLIKSDGAVNQLITGFISSVYSFIDPVNLEDINFDGHLDIMIPEESGAKSTSYSFWVYDPESELFIHHDELFATDPVIDVQHNQIISESSASASVYITEKYTWQDGKFYLVESTEKDYELGKTSTKKFKIVNGQAVEI